MGWVAQPNQTPLESKLVRRSETAATEALLLPRVHAGMRYDLEVEKAVAHCAGLYLIRVSELSPAQ